MPRGTDRYDEARLQGRLWTPRHAVDGDIALWVETLDTVVSVDGSNNLSQLNDKSGFNRHVVQASAANRPPWSYTALGGKPAVTFNGANLRLADLPVGTTSTVFSIYTVAALASTGAASFARLISFGLAGAEDWNNAAYCNIQRNGTTAAIGTARNSLVNYTTVTYDQPFVAAAIHNGTNATLYLNGSAGTPIAVSGAFSIVEGRIGGHMQNGSVNWSGPVAAIIIDRAVPTTRRSQLIEGYLGWRFRIALVGAHPFANRPPLIGD